MIDGGYSRDGTCEYLVTGKSLVTQPATLIKQTKSNILISELTSLASKNRMNLIILLSAALKTLLSLEVSVCTVCSVHVCEQVVGSAREIIMCRLYSRNAQLFQFDSWDK